MAGTDPTLDEFDDSAIDGAWTQAGAGTMLEDGAEGGTINFATVPALQLAGLYQEYPNAGDYSTTIDLVQRVKVDATMTQGGDELYTKNAFILWDNDINIEINLGWIADKYFAGGDNLGADRYMLETTYDTIAETETDTIEIPAPITNGWCYTRMAHVAGELKLFFSPDPFTQWYDITPVGVSTYQGQVGGTGGYGWGFEIDHSQSHNIACNGNYRGYTDFIRDSSGFSAGGASSGISATLDGEAVEISEQVIERYGDYIVYIDSSNILKIKDSSITDFTTDVPIAVSATHL